jgi:hypothetical protein
MHRPQGHDLVCFSHLRWDYVWQRPQQLLSAAARDRRVFYVEEPRRRRGPTRLDVLPRAGGVTLLVPRLPKAMRAPDAIAVQRRMIRRFFSAAEVSDPILWYYSPLALSLARDLPAAAVVYDCMDQLSAFRYAPPWLVDYEEELLDSADIVFTGGQSLYEEKRRLHPNVHAFPSSVDVAHFARARRLLREPSDQASIPRPRLGFFGVIDERMDLDMLAAIADARPEWNLVLVGPTVKIALSDRPRRPNIHYLDRKPYGELPAYVAGWDVALLPFARNQATRFISPTKTPEYLAAGKAIVSTSIRDVVRPYGVAGLVRIADTPEDFVAACEAALRDDLVAHARRADALLDGMSWDRTWNAMSALVKRAVAGRATREPAVATAG